MTIKILVADDEHLIRERIYYLLKEIDESFIISTAKDGIDLLEKAELEIQNIIICDIKMPYLDGLDAIKTLRKKSEDTVIIIISGFDIFQYAKQAIRLGVLAYLLKPINISEFNETLQKAIGIINKPKSFIIEAPILNSENDIIDYINENFTRNDLNANNICNKFHISQSSLLRYIKKNTGTGFNAYITKMRMENAISDILYNTNQLSIKEIAEKSGYNNQLYFSRAFKQYTGISPREYQKIKQ